MFANSEFTATSGNITTANNKKRLDTMSDWGKSYAGKQEMESIS